MHPRSRLTIVPSHIERPEPSSDWLPATKEAWNTFWTEPGAGFVIRSDLPALVRLFSLRDDREQAMRGYRRKKLVGGSTGQPIVNPLARMAATWDAEIRQLEDRFALNLTARLKVGLHLGEAQKTLEELNRTVEDADQDEDDPAAALLQSSPDGRRTAIAVSRVEDKSVD